MPSFFPSLPPSYFSPIFSLSSLSFPEVHAPVRLRVLVRVWRRGLELFDGERRFFKRKKQNKNFLPMQERRTAAAVPVSVDNKTAAGNRMSILYTCTNVRSTHLYGFFLSISPQVSRPFFLFYAIEWWHDMGMKFHQYSWVRKKTKPSDISVAPSADYLSGRGIKKTARHWFAIAAKRQNKDALLQP
jgi:hypothetical protein